MAVGGHRDDRALAACRGLLDALPDPAWIFDLATRRVLQSNAAALALLGLRAEALHEATADALLPTAEDHAWWAAMDPSDPEPLRSETQVAAADGRLLYCQRSIHAIPGTAWGLVCVSDLSRRRRAEDEREAVVAELQATLEAVGDGLLVTDRDGAVRSCNRRLAEIWSLPQALFERRDGAAILQWVQHSLEDPGAWEQRLQAWRASPLMVSTERLALLTGQVIECVARPLLQRGRPVGRVYSFRDLTATLNAETRVAEVAATDLLTGLANRRQLADRVTETVAAAHRHGGRFALLMVDLDHFRHINDSLGHEQGDRVLVDISRRLSACLRSDDLLARIGGDQFALLVGDADAAAAEATARRVLALVAQPCELDGTAFTLTCSIGVALFPANGHSLDGLVSHAEAATRMAKEAGRAGYRMTLGVQHGRAPMDLKRHMALDHGMRQALVSGRFRLHYQPQIELATGRLVGAEALIRWRDPEQGEISPGQFIPVAEDTGFIIAIGDWVLSQAVRQAALWHERGTPLRIAVNVSALQFQQTQFVDRVASVLAVSGLPPALLELELTESILVRDAEEALHRLNALSRLGVRLSIDDFGTGYSSLAYLKRFPIDKLKVDRSFVKGLPADESDAGIVRAILQMARALNLVVIAEGVETELQRQFLLDAGCQMFQGFLFAPALDSVSFEKRLLPKPEPSAERTPVRLVHG